MRLTTDNISEDSNHDFSSIVETKTQTFLPLYLYVIHTSVTVATLTHTTPPTPPKKKLYTQHITI